MESILTPLETGAGVSLDVELSEVVATAGEGTGNTHINVSEPAASTPFGPSSGQESALSSDYSLTGSAPSSSLISISESSSTPLTPTSAYLLPLDSTSTKINTTRSNNDQTRVAADVTSFRPSSRDIISGIAPHVFDERRRRRQRGSRRSSHSHDYYYSSRSRSRSRSQRRASLDSTATTATRYSVTCESSPLRVSAVIDDLDLLLDSTVISNVDKGSRGNDTINKGNKGNKGNNKENRESQKPSKTHKNKIPSKQRPHTEGADFQPSSDSKALDKRGHLTLVRGRRKMERDTRSTNSVPRRNSLNVKMDSLKMGLKDLIMDIQVLKTFTGKLKTKP